MVAIAELLANSVVNEAIKHIDDTITGTEY